MEELIDVYDAQRKPLGFTRPRKGLKLEPGQFMLYSLAVITNKDGKYLITQRSADKGWGAGWWEVTGGGVPSGQTADVSIVREIAEEVGLDASKANPEVIYTYVNEDTESGSNYIVDIFAVHLDFEPEDIVLQVEETQDFALVDWEDIVALNEQGIFLHFKRIAAALGK